MLYGMLGAPTPGELGAQSLYAQTGVLGWLCSMSRRCSVFVVGMIVLTVRLGRVGRIRLA